MFIFVRDLFPGGPNVEFHRFSKSRKQEQLARDEIEFARRATYVYCIRYGLQRAYSAFFLLLTDRHSLILFGLLESLGPQRILLAEDGQLVRASSAELKRAKPPGIHSARW
jgi:hypothetical protein